MKQQSSPCTSYSYLLDMAVVARTVKYSTLTLHLVKTKSEINLERQQTTQVLKESEQQFGKQAFHGCLI